MIGCTYNLSKCDKNRVNYRYFSKISIYLFQ